MVYRSLQVNGIRFLVMLQLVAAMLFTTSNVPAAAQTQDDADQAAATAIHLSELEANRDTAALYDLLHPDAAAIIPEEVIAGWYQNDFFPPTPQPIGEITSVTFVTWVWEATGTTYNNTAEVSFIQPFGSGADTTYVSEKVRLVQSRNGQWRWFFGRSEEFVNEQSSTYAHDDTPTSSRTDRPENATTSSQTRRSNPNTGQSSQVSSAGCTLVELEPGYPGYRGLVTGLSPKYGGLGDWDCLETLERDHPQFGRSREDRENSEAAEELGIDGDPSVWLWENWMAIEAYRGLPTHCYACLMFDDTVAPINAALTQDWTDPRVTVGFVGSRTAIETYLPAAVQRNNFDDNYQLRAHAFFRAGPFANALDIIAVFESMANDSWSENWYAVKPDRRIFSNGGYSWVSEKAYPDDQVFGASYALSGATWQTPPYLESIYLPAFDNLVLNWQSELLTGSTESLADYLSREWPY